MAVQDQIAGLEVFGFKIVIVLALILPVLLILINEHFPSFFLFAFYSGSFV